MNREFPSQIFVGAVGPFLGLLLCATFLAQRANSDQRTSQNDAHLSFAEPFASVDIDASDRNRTSKNSFTIPLGTILPVRLNSTISSAKCRPGQTITGRIMQEVPLPHGARIRSGSRVIGHIVEVTRATGSERGRVSLQFDRLTSSDQTISMTTNLRAIAGFMRIVEAQTPPIGPGESDVYRWLTTVQVGGDVVYGEGGVVTAGENSNQVVGRAVNGGVLGQVRAKEGTNCRGAIDGNDSPQALWVFSSDACGVYGLEHIRIAHTGRSDPTGVIVLTSDGGNIKIAGGAGMLLRVNGSRDDLKASY